MVPFQLCTFLAVKGAHLENSTLWKGIISVALFFWECSWFVPGPRQGWIYGVAAATPGIQSCHPCCHHIYKSDNMFKYMLCSTRWRSRRPAPNSCQTAITKIRGPLPV